MTKYRGCVITENPYKKGEYVFSSKDGDFPDGFNSVSEAKRTIDWWHDRNNDTLGALIECG